VSGIYAPLDQLSDACDVGPLLERRHLLVRRARAYGEIRGDLGRSGEITSSNGEREPSPPGGAISTRYGAG